MSGQAVHNALRESAAIYRAIDQKGELSAALNLLSLAAAGLGNISEARRYLYAGLQLTMEVSTGVYFLGIALAAAAHFLAHRGNHEQAVELYALILRYPIVANSRWSEAVIGRQIDSAMTALPADVVSAAQKRGHALDPQVALLDLVAQLAAQDGSPAGG